VTHLAAQVGLVLSCAAVVLGACTGAGDSPAPSPSDTPPSITKLDVECDAEEAEWALDVKTDAWTGNGRVSLSADGDYVELHPFYSVESAPDGTADRLALDLSVVPDWREVTLGASTVFNCAAPSLTGLVQVWTRDGSEQGDCITFGEAPERWAEWAPPGCDEVWVPEE
jgi:hypothetical protein